MAINIRPETAADAKAIYALTKRAFEGHPYSDGQEADIINQLRADGDLLLSLVALDAEQVIGQITYSRAILANGDEGWAVLGPMAVAPPRQGQGIGRALIARGEAELRALGMQGIAVLGDPALYSRFGFAQNTPMRLEGALGEYLQVKSFAAPIPTTTISYAPAFGEGED